MRWLTFASLLLMASRSRAGSPAEALSAAHADIQRIGALEQQYTRYLYCGHLESGAAKRLQWQVTSAHVNSISLKRRVVPLAVILADDRNQLTDASGFEIAEKDWSRAILFRLNIEWYGWSPKVWEKLARVEPHFRFLQPDTAGKLTRVPVAAPAAVVEKVYVFRNGFEAVSASEVREGETVYEKVGERSYREIKNPALRRLIREKQAEDEPKIDRKTLRASWVDVKQDDDLRKWSHSDVPILYADFFWWQTSVQAEREPGPGYYDFLEIKDQNDFYKRVGFDPVLFRAKFAEFVKQYREAVARSGVSRQPRRIFVEDKLGGEYWATLDNRKAVGNRNPLDTPDDRFRYDATEVMAHGANGILVMGLFDSDGNRQDVAPDLVGPDSTSTDNDGRIHVGQCWRCHDDGLKNLKGWYKNVYKPPLTITGPDYKRITDLQEQYFDRIEDRIQPARDRHAVAIFKASGLTLKKYSAGIRECWKVYHSDGVDLKRAARDVGTTPANLVAAIKGLKARRKDGTAPLQGIRVYDVFTLKEEDQEPIGVDQYHEAVSELHLIVLARGKP